MYYLHTQLYLEGFIRCRVITSESKLLDVFNYPEGKEKYSEENIQIAFDNNQCNKLLILYELGNKKPDDEINTPYKFRKVLNFIILELSNKDSKIYKRINNHNDVIRILSRVLRYRDDYIEKMINKIPLYKAHTETLGNRAIIELKKGIKR